MKKRLYSLDIFKGILIILVIIGHVLDAYPNSDIDRNNFLPLAIIYSFHIPVFIGLSGFLLNVKKIVGFNFLGLLKNYKYRVILPWLIAAIVYFPFSDRFSLNVLYPVEAIILPYYHLWFIPAFLSWIILTWLLKKISMNNLSLLLISFIISILAVALKKYSSSYLHVVDVLKPYYYFFFVFGLYAKESKKTKFYLTELFIIFLSLAAVIYYFYFPNKILSTLNLFLLNITILWILITISRNNVFPENRFLEWVGKNSLGLYLWHVIPILVVKKVLVTDNLFLFYGLMVILEILLFGMYYILSKIKIFKKYAFGL